MSSIKIQNIQNLIKKGKKKGYITHTEIDSIFEDGSIYSESLDNFFDTITKEGIKIAEEFEKKDEEKEEIEEAKIEREPTEIKDAIEIYLQEISRIPLLTSKEELLLAKKISTSTKEIREIEKRYRLPIVKIKGVYKRWVHKQITKEELPSSLKNLTAENFKELIKEITAIEDISHKSKKNFIEANLRLVVSIAKKYSSRRLPFLDLIDEGNLGMMKAVDKFDYKQGHKFSTYATWWIKHTIVRAIADQSRTIRVPVYMIETISKCIKVIRNLLQELGREPTLEEISKKMQISIHKIIEIINISQEPSSLEAPVGSSGNSILGDLIEGSESLSPLKAVFLNLLQDEISKLLENLNEKEKTIIKLRFGLENYKPHTLEETGKIIGITRERVRQLEFKALQKLNELKVSRELHDFLLEH
ncbi:MAG: sigma-70 family RNA polymerase sigma factor [bacterium]|nr:sigma-70 family RNA polymerase sigma factor [bacterium]